MRRRLIMLFVSVAAVGSRVEAQPGAVTEQSDAHAAATVILVIGTQGEARYGHEFSKWADRWQQAAETSNVNMTIIGRDQTHPVRDRELLMSILQKQTADRASQPNVLPLWLVLVGHGTYDGLHAKFNLRGPDVSASDLAQSLADSHRPTVIINCAAASGPFLKTLSAPNRVVITATKSGHEHNYARFGDYLSQAIGDAQADLDKDGQTSLLEAFLKASKRTQEFYDSDGRLTTEHAQLDDNADGQGARAESFRGIRPTHKPNSGAELDGYRAHQFHLIPSDRERGMPLEARRKRDELELQVIKLRDRKSEFGPDKYYSELEEVLVQLAGLYSESDR